MFVRVVGTCTSGIWGLANILQDMNLMCVPYPTTCIYVVTVDPGTSATLDLVSLVHLYCERDWPLHSVSIPAQIAHVSFENGFLKLAVPKTH